MFWTTIQRVIKSGFVNFWRNGFVSLASILVMIITLFVVGAIIFTNVMLVASLNQIKDKVDINAYFITTAKEDDILAIKKSLEAMPEVKQVTYTNREQALAAFKESQLKQNQESMLEALDELQGNPLGAALNIKAKEPSQYGGIVDFINSKSVSHADGLSILDTVNYHRNKTAIDTLTKIIDSGSRIGFFLTIALVAMSIIITFNTIRLAIYSSREEISVMRLVGASSTYVRGPFVVVGIMYGIIAAIFTMGIFYPITYYLGRATENFFGGVNVYGYYVHNFAELLLVLLFGGVLVGAISSYLAVRRYLTV